MNPRSFHSARASVIAVLRGKPYAVAEVAGSAAYKDITGAVLFYQTHAGVLVFTEVMGLPGSDTPCGGRIFGFHIHEGPACGGSSADPFAEAMSHYDPNGCPHPFHAGDLPPLFGSGGSALSIFLTDRFTISNVIGKTVIIHDSPDDFSTQPSGDSGEKIACGVIRRS